LARKSQIFSVDFITSIVSFLIFFMIFFLVYGEIKGQTAQSGALKDAQETAALLSDELVRTAGVPSNWTNETVVTLGLASEEGILSLAKIQSLGNMTYASTKDNLILGGFDYFLNLSNFTNAAIFTYGTYPPENASFVLPVRRLVLYDNGSARSLATLQVVVWKE
jgi:hypothetical protein